MKRDYPRFEKNVPVGSPEYNRLLALEIQSWARKNPEKEGGWQAIQNTVAFQTYRKGTVETMINFVRGDVLELGSSDGWFSNLVKNSARSVVSIDVALNGDFKYDGNIKTIQGDLNQIEKIEGLGTYDCIVTRGTLHHLVDPLKTITFAFEKLLRPNGVLIVDDNWIRQPRQFIVDAFLYTLLQNIPQSLFYFFLGKNNFSKFLKELGMLFVIPFKWGAAEAIVNNHKFSPFEAISSADDYRSFYTRHDINLLYFKRLGAFSTWHFTYLGRLRKLGRLVDSIDKWCVERSLFAGNIHIAVMTKKDKVG